MKELDLLESSHWSIGKFFGSDHPFFHINTPTIIHTWIVLGVIFALALIARIYITKEHSIGQHLVLSFVRNFMAMCTQSMGTFHFNHFSFITSVFVFILVCNLISLIPYLDEPTTDLNTTLAMGVVTFLYTQAVGIQATGLWGYIKSYFEPFIPMFPLNVVGKLASVISVSFRLFGNIFGGAIITKIYGGAIQSTILSQVLGMTLGLNITIVLFFTLFEGFLQAFVFAMLALTYLSMALQGEGH